MADHAKRSPSHAVTWMLCAGALPLSKGMPNPSSPYADEGTRAHSLAEAILTNKVLDKPDPEMLKHVMTYVDFVWEIMAANVGAVLHVEMRVSVTPDCWGTADCIIWCPATQVLYVIDLKYGAGVAVSVNGNLQLKIYGLAALLTTGYKAKTIVVGICQPRMPNEDGMIRMAEYSTLDMMDFYADLRDALTKVTEAEQSALPADEWNDAYLRPSEKSCRWCLAAPKCPKLTAQAQQMCKQVFMEAAPYDRDQLAKVLDMLPVMEGWIKNVRQFAYDEAEAGRVPPGYKLVEKRATRKWRPDLNKFVLASVLKVKMDEILKPSELLGVAELEKLCQGKNAAERAAVLEPFVIKESSGHTLVHESDNRQAVRLDAAAVFPTLK